jgi:hypothetical protein
VLEPLSRRLLSFLRVPAEPRLPAGDPASARVFRASPRFFTLQLLRWATGQVSTLLGLVGLLVVLEMVPETVSVKAKGARRPFATAPAIAWVRSVETLAWTFWILQVPLTFAVMRLDYELRWYIVTDRAARVREGILNLSEMTFTLANVQDIRIHQGPLQRVLGLADVELRTAGGSEGPTAAAGGHGVPASRNLHLARFRGVDNAEAIRDLVLDRMKRARDSGLGDPDDDHDVELPHAAAEDLARALDELRAASTALREAAARRA